MTESKINGAGVAAEAPAKKIRRGISNETQATARLRFHEKDAAPNRLFMAHLHSVTVAWSVNADGKSFTGEKVPRLVFEFASNTKDASQRRYVDKTLFPAESNVETIPGGDKAWQVDSIFRWIKHILDVFYLKGRAMTAAEEDALTLSFCDYDEDGNYVPVDVKDVLAGYAQLFNNVAAMMNGTFGLAEGETPKPCFRDENGAYRRCWIKLLRHYKQNGKWKNVTNGDLSFTGFVGTGAVELAAQPNSPALILNVDESKESITPKDIKEAPSIPGMTPGMDGGIMVAGTGIPATGGSAYQEAAEDMPF